MCRVCWRADCSNLVTYYFQRHNIKPGITGIAQVSGYRGSTAVPPTVVKRIDRDLRYIETWSLWLDNTVARELTGGSGH